MVINLKRNRFLLLASVAILLAAGSFLNIECATLRDLFTLQRHIDHWRSPATIRVAVAGFASTWVWNILRSSKIMNKSAGHETVAFVREVLKDAGYEQNQIDKIKIFEGGQFVSRIGAIYVPFNDELLLRARHYYETKEEIKGPDLSLLERVGTILRERYKHWKDTTDEELSAVLQVVGTIATKDSIPLWRGFIIHEMGHIQHHHCFKHLLFASTIHSLSCAYCIPFLSRLTGWKSLMTIPIPAVISYTANFLTQPLRRPQEKQADAEVAGRVRDVEILEAMAKCFELYARLKRSRIEKVKLFFDEHPKDIDRSRFFGEAAERLREKQSSTEYALPQHSGS